MLTKSFGSREHQVRQSFSDQRGFALIITLSLLAFLVLILFALTSLMRVETDMAGSSQQMYVARENAKMALNIAVGQLQRHAGPDQRLTARADIDPSNDNNPYWTGVWDDNRLETWLVSGNDVFNRPLEFRPNFPLGRTTDPYVQPGSYSHPGGYDVDFIRLLWRGSAAGARHLDDVSPDHGAVVVPRVPIFSRKFPGLADSTTPTSGHIVGHYAYWIGDEGAKVSLSLPELHKEVTAYNDFFTPVVIPGPSQEDEMKRRLRQLLPQRYWFQGGDTTHDIFTDYLQYDLSETVNETFSRVIDRNQYGLRLGNNDDGLTMVLSEGELKRSFHDVTHMNYGVLADTEFGGLKRDLSNSTSTAIGYRDFLDVRPKLLGPALGGRVFEMQSTASEPGINEPGLIIGPVVSEMSIRYVVWVNDTNQLMIRVECDVEVWNPYSVDLEGEPLLLVLESMPPVQANYETATVSEERTIDIEQSLANFIPITFPSPVLAAGEIITVRFESVDLSAADDDGATFLPYPVLALGETALLSLSGDGSTIRAELRRVNVPDAVPLARFLLEYNSIEVVSYPATEESERFGFYARLADQIDDPEWLRLYDPRMLGLQNTADCIAFEIEANPIIGANSGVDFDSDPQILNTGNIVQLFELPLQEPVSLGSLQHLYFQGRPAYSLGNPWGGDPVNSDFDRFFLSTVPQNGEWGKIADWDFPLPNTRLIPFRSIDPGTGNSLPNTTSDLRSEESAQHLLLQGMFNINSTSLTAWKSVLSSVNIRKDGNDIGQFNPDPDPAESGDWIYDDGGLEIGVTHGVFRFSQTAHFSGNFFTVAEIESSLMRAYRQGVRELSQTAVDDLAFEIVNQLRVRERPFVSLSDFASSTLLEDAIKAVNLNGSIQPYSAAFITPGDILTAMAPFMLARSDTFIVRAYGDAHNPVKGEVEARAYCEAIVQRVPTPLDIDDQSSPMANPTGAFGRKFEIIFFRWLQPDEL